MIDQILIYGFPDHAIMESIVLLLNRYGNQRKTMIVRKFLETRADRIYQHGSIYILQLDRTL